MGVYDTVIVPCPRCGERHDFQSKSGPCDMKFYELDETPDDVFDDINRHAPTECFNCGTWFHVDEKTKDIAFSTKEEIIEKQKEEREMIERLEKLARIVKEGKQEG